VAARTPPAQTALLLVECQNGVIGEGSVLPDLAKEAAPQIPTLARLAQGARDAGVLVCHLTFVPKAGNRSANRKPVLFAGMLAGLDDWGPDHPATQVVDAIGVADGDLVLPRSSGLSPTYGQETLPVLRNLGITRLAVAGVSTNIAIPAVLTNAVDEGFDVVVPGDAAIGSPGDYAQAMLRYTIGMISKVTTVDKLLAEWSEA
jgi:nicotinamidase-related amidase